MVNRPPLSGAPCTNCGWPPELKATAAPEAGTSSRAAVIWRSPSSPPQHYPTAISSLAPLGRHSLALYDTVATTFPAVSRTFARCLLRIRRYHSEQERIPLTRARIAR
jgi:hypothetical protein